MFFSRTRSFARALAGAQAAGGSFMNFSLDETEDDETEDAVYECALAELLAEGVASSVA